MRKVKLVLLFLYVGIHALQAQNLVPNGSFEFFVMCPEGVSYDDRYLKYATPWNCPTNTSPDFFHKCNNTTPEKNAGVPKNIRGFQYANYGNGYAGFFVRSGTDPQNSFREYIQTPLKNILVAGRSYCVSFYINLGDAKNANIYGSDDVGVYFSDTALKDNTNGPLPYVPQIKNPEGNMITDTGKWVQIKDTYVAKGGEIFMIIGNFNTNENTNIELVHNRGAALDYCYFFIDDITVTETNLNSLSIGNDTLIKCSDSLVLKSNFIGYPCVWSTGETTDAITVRSSGQYILTIDHGCGIYKDTVNVIFQPAFSIDHLDLGTNFHFPCGADTSIILTANVDNVTYLWSTGERTKSIHVNSPGMYWVNVINECGSRSDFIEIDPPIGYALDLGDNITEPCRGAVLLQATPSAYPCTYEWSTGETDPQIIATQNGAYTLRVINECGVFEDSIYISMGADINNAIRIPNAFSPNGDGKNDVLMISNEYPECNHLSLTIYDRWGKLIYSSKELLLTWDGKLNGTIAVEGVYIYLLKGKDYNETGTITLLR
jgi:gliding motility-associated-like protein